MAYIFNPDELHAVARRAVGLKSRDAACAQIISDLRQRFPKHVTADTPWLFNNAGGAMGQMKLLHCSLSEYILIFNTPIGTEGHSGRYATEVWDFMIDGEMWCYHPGEFERTVFKPGDAAYLGEDKVKGYAVPSHAMMLEYARGPIPTMLPFGLSDTVFSTLDHRTVGQTIYHYGRLVVGQLLQGKI
jgi:ERG2 and Sigma1 receptor like protein